MRGDVVNTSSLFISMPSYAMLFHHMNPAFLKYLIGNDARNRRIADQLFAFGPDTLCHP